MSEERNQNLEEQPLNAANETNASNPAIWETQLRDRANVLLAQRIAPLKAEIERLQINISEISSRLNDQESGISEQESSGLLESIRRWFSVSAAKAEEDFKSRLEEARAEIAATIAAREDVEKGFQHRIEQACADAAAVARREAEVQLEDMREQLEASRKALTLAVSSAQQTSTQSVNFDAFKAAIEDIDSQRTQSDTLSALVRRAAQFAPRVVFYVIKSGAAVGWKASGFENGLNDETVKLLSVPSQKQTLLREALTSFRVITDDPQSTGSGADVLGLYSSPAPERAVAIPLIVFNKAAAVLYTDSGTQSESSINQAAVESLVRITGKTIELLLSRRGAEPARASVSQAQLSPSNAANAAAAEVSITPAQGTAVKTIPQPAVQPESARIEPAVPQDSKNDTRRAAREYARVIAEPQIEQINQTAPVTPDDLNNEKHKTEELEAPPGAETQIESASRIDENLRQAEAQLPEPAYIETEPDTGPRRITKEVTDSVTAAPGGSGPFEPRTAQSPSAYAQQTATGETPPSAPTLPISDFGAPSIDERPTAPGISAFQAPPPPPPFTPPVEPSRPAQPIAPVPTPGSETEQRAHNDARRFARLLVSEIKLYNAAKVNDGRRNYDLYDRLKDEIDRSRKVYDKRVSPAVAARFDYFYDELVQTLAEGDPAKLGKNCPGPVVLA